MPPDQFLPKLQLIPKSRGFPKGGVLAEGKLGPDDWVVELCAWVVQHKDDGDVAATEMTTSTKGKSIFAQDPLSKRRNRSWRLPLATVSKESMQEKSPAFALAIGLIADKTPDGKQQMLSWGQTVALEKVLEKTDWESILAELKQSP